VALGEVLTDPKAEVWFAAQDCPRSLCSVRLDAKTRMLYDNDCVFINGESWRCQGADARSLRLLADERRLSGLDSLSPQLGALLKDWVQAGWLHAGQS
jgi:50S ribosomal protein L16 3-hydroxylase